MLARRLSPLLLPLALAGCSGGTPQDDASAGTSAGSTTADTGSSGGESDTGTTTGDAGACPVQTPAGLMNCVDRDRYLDDLQFISDVRTPGSPHWQAVQDLCADRLTELGYAVTLQDYGTGVNVLGTRPGTTSPGEQVVVGAHYDHIANCSGADDNGSGVSAALEVARVLADVPTSRTLVIACWDEEELGLLGSKAHAQAAQGGGDTIVAVLDLDSMGYATDEPGSQSVPAGFDLVFAEEYAELVANDFRGDFLLWVGDESMKPYGDALEVHAAVIGLPTIGTLLEDVIKNEDVVADLRRSDHASFWAVDIPALFFNDTADFRYPYYHCYGGDDVVAEVNLDFAVKVTQVTAATAGEALGI
ncbi:MAG: M28 family peptidase [Myxococcales bacterium]|nr:M28 family peptidase [Myxococcales bacterium]